MKSLKISIQFIIILISLTFFSCKKNDDGVAVGDNGQQIIKIAKYGGISGEGYRNSGLAFDLTVPIDSVQVQLEYSSSSVPSNDVIITIAQDDAERVKFVAANSMIDYNTVTSTQFLF